VCVWRKEARFEPLDMNPDALPMTGDQSDVVDIFNMCPAGCFFSNLICSQCAAGSYNSLSGQSSCTPCPAGLYNPSLGSLSCSLCARGTYSGLGQSSCSDCPPGSYCPDTAKSPVICPPGSYCPAKSFTSVKCDLGYLCSQEGLSQQSPCPSGHYCPSSVQDVPCPAGTFSSSTGAFFIFIFACDPAGYFPRTSSAAANPRSLCRASVCVHLPALLFFAELP
jgi:hypothetical protein